MKQPPFLVICVKSFSVENEMFKNLPEPCIGDIDTVTGIHEEEGLILYTLERFNQNYGYAALCFAILPDTTEEVAVECEKEAIVNLETAVA